MEITRYAKQINELNDLTQKEQMDKIREINNNGGYVDFTDYCERCTNNQELTTERKSRLEIGWKNYLCEIHAEQIAYLLEHHKIYGEIEKLNDLVKVKRKELRLELKEYKRTNTPQYIKKQNEIHQKLRKEYNESHWIDKKGNNMF